VEDHPTIEDFARFLASSPRPSKADRNALIVRHLLVGCPTCRGTLQDLKGARPLLARLLENPVPRAGKDRAEPAPPLDYGWAFARAERTFAATLAHGGPPERLPERLAELAGLPDGEQLRRVGRGGRFADPGFIHCLLERSHAARYRSPRKTLHLARLALAAVAACAPKAAGGERALADLKAEAWRAFANAQRICGNLPEAEKAFTAALQDFEAGTGSPGLRARVLSQLSSLRVFQRRFEEAVAFAEEAAKIYDELGEDHLLAGALVQQATPWIYSGKPERAAKILLRALPGIDRSLDFQLFLAAHHNLARCYIDLGQPEEALALHFKARELYQECVDDPMILLRATWQEGQLLREIGHLRNAEAALLRARQGFAEQGLAYESAMVSLDLAEVYSKLGLAAELQRTIAEALPIFRSLRVEREFMASLLRLQQAGEVGAGVETEPPG
jgi:tetratricopeptide (TPR) repeat protein